MDETLIQNAKEYFSYLRKSTLNSLRSTIGYDLCILVRFSAQSNYPIDYLLHFGICFFSNNTCAIQINTFCKAISSSKSRVNNCFKQEKFTLIETPYQKEKIALETELKRVFGSQAFNIKTWTFRRIDENSNFLKELKGNPLSIVQLDEINLQSKEQVQNLHQFESQALQPQILQPKNEIFLSYQKDVFTWTFYDESLSPE